MPNDKKPENESSSLWQHLSFTGLKDALKNYHEPKITRADQQEYQGILKILLKQMQVSPEIAKQVIEAGNRTTTEKDFDRATQMLHLLLESGVTGKLADEFFKGGHFILNDGGKLYEKMTALEGAETRYSSHFADIRTGEKGLNCGRIIPEVLMIETNLDGQKRSHFQAESSPWRGGGMPTLQALQTSEHITDATWFFINKKISEIRGQEFMNLGPFGWSNHGDKNNPIVDMTITSKQTPAIDLSANPVNNVKMLDELPTLSTKPSATAENAPSNRL